MEIIKTNLSFREMGVICAAINMYCNGPPYHKAKKDLTETEKGNCNDLWNFFRTAQEKIINHFPELFSQKPYSWESKKMKGEIQLSRKEIELIIRLIKTTLAESEGKGNDRELQMLVAPYKEVEYCLQLLVDARQKLEP